ncbi:MAG TPA: hypothetical protein VLF14_06630 [Candidatus Binatia bacterium]|nr:hypothetical protein [Candidatus Binatia bacterium]
MRDVILAKTVGRGALTLTNPQSGNYEANLTLPVAGGLTMSSAPIRRTALPTAYGPAITQV